MSGDGLNNNMNLREHTASGIPFILGAFFIYAAHSLAFRHWIIDDAGISFSYARNLAGGFGLVSQPGSVPVEGYSNFLWVILQTPFFFFDAFNPVVTPKIVSAILVLFTTVLLYQSMLKMSDSKLISFCALVFIMINSSFVIWTSSGLENPLYVLFIVLCFSIIISELRYKEILLGISVALVALTRPDGVIYFVVFPVILIFSILSKEIDIRTSLRKFAIYASLFCIIYGGYVLFRYHYFNDIFPNTYYAKVDASDFTKQGFLTAFMLNQEALARLTDLFQSVWGRFYVPVSVVLLTSTGYLVSRGEYRKRLIIVLVFLIVSLELFMILPKDYMGEYRFGTPAIVFIYLYTLLTFKFILDSFKMSASVKKFVAGSLILCALMISADAFAKRSMDYSMNPYVPFTKIAKRYIIFDRYAEALNIKNASLLVPDFGGTSYYSKLRLYDLGMLCDRTIARTLGKDQEGFYDYVFNLIKPTFIHTHGYWAELAKLDKDKRFRRDYTPVEERYVSRINMYEGDYIRNDSLGDPGRIDVLRRLTHAPDARVLQVGH